MTPNDPDETSSLLLGLARMVTARRRLEDVLSETFRCLRACIDFGGGSIQLLDDDGWIRMAAAEPPAPDHVMAARIPLGGSVAGRVILTEQPVYIADLEAGVDERGDGPVSTGVRSYLGVPLLADGRAIGVLQLDASDPDAWSREQRALLTATGPVVAAAIQCARAHEQVSAAEQRREQVESRLVEARRLVASLRWVAGREEGLQRELDRLERILEGLPTPREQDRTLHV